MTDEEERLKASEDMRRERALQKFKMSRSDREAVKKVFMDIIDRQFDSLEGTYMQMFASLPLQTLEEMTEQQASEFVSEVVKGAAGSLMQSSESLRQKVSETAANPERMSSAAKNFMEKMGFKTEEEGLGEKNSSEN